MKTVTLKSILTALAAAGGQAFTLDATTSQVTAEQRLQLIAHVNTATRDAWEFFPWWQCARLEERQFRPDWSAVPSYALDAEVFDPTTQRYYRSLQAANLNHAVTLTAWWEPAPDLDCYISLEPDAYFPAATEIGTLTDVFDADPRLSAGARGSRLIYELRDDRVQFRPDIATVTVWLSFQAAAPRLDGTNYSASETVAAGTVRYYHTTGECYRALTSTSNVPTNTTDWAPVLLPHHLASAIVQSARAHWLRADGQDEKAEIAEAKSLNLIERAIIHATAHVQQHGRFYN